MWGFVRGLGDSVMLLGLFWCMQGWGGLGCSVVGCTWGLEERVVCALEGWECCRWGGLCWSWALGLGLVWVRWVWGVRMSAAGGLGLGDGGGGGGGGAILGVGFDVCAGKMGWRAEGEVVSPFIEQMGRY